MLSASTPSTVPAGLIPLAALLAAAGTNERALKDWRRRGLFPFEPLRVFGGVHGSASFYEPAALLFLRRLRELQRENRDPDRWLWELWLDPADYPIDIGKWAANRLAETAELIEAARRLDSAARAKGARMLYKRHGIKLPVAGMGDRVRNPESRQEAYEWILRHCLGEPRAEINQATPPDLAEPSFFDLLGKLIGLPADTPFGDGKISKRGVPFWIALFRRVLRETSATELEQARRDWREIAGIMARLETVDWSAAPPLFPIGSSRKPPSHAARDAQRTRPLPPPGIVSLLLSLWRDYNGRAAVLCALLLARRRFAAHPRPGSYMSGVGMVDQAIGMLGQWAATLPPAESRP